jgi:Zn-finger nucleic acid-binding protein
MYCPTCHEPINRHSQPPFLLWRCHRCEGCAVTIAMLRRGIRNDLLQKAWDRTVGREQKRNRRCPGCSTFMYLVPTVGPEIDLCRSCQMIWFDAGELNKMPERSESELLDERWKNELRDWQARRERKAAERRADTRRHNRMRGQGVYFVL